MDEMTRAQPMSFFSENVDAWGAAEWFDRLAKAVRGRNAAVLAKDDMAFETCNNVASSSASRLVSDFEEQVRAALAAQPAAPVGESLDRYVPDIVKNAMLTMWNYICDDTKSHPLDIDHGKGKYLTFTPRHWAQFTGEMVQRNLRDLYAAPPPSTQKVSRDVMAETIHNARWPADRQMAITPFADEDRNGREYCFRIADAVLAALSTNPGEQE